MKKIFIIILLLSATFLFGTELNTYSLVIRDNSPEGYKEIKEAAIAEWGTDHTMVLYEINTQCKSLFNVIQSIVTPASLIIFKEAFKYWSYPGMVKYNIEIYNKWIDEGNLFDLFTMKCDWTMVEYEFNLQMESAAAY